MSDPALSAFLENTLKEEIVPFVSDDIAATTVFADSVKERFKNPYLNHQLTSIALNSISKWRARNLPSFTDYYNKFGKIPTYLTIGFSYLMMLYSNVKLVDGKYFVKMPTRTIELLDNAEYLEYFANGGSVEDFMKDVNAWGEDLTLYNGFLDAVKNNLELIKNGTKLI